jgi:hypothetical protein
LYHRQMASTVSTISFLSTQPRKNPLAQVIG